MATVSVMYPSSAGSKFDVDHYLGNYMKMVAETWGLAGVRGHTVLKGRSSPDGGAPPFQVIVNLDFVLLAAIQAALDASGAKVMGDVPNCTDSQPTLQITEVADRFTRGG